MAGQAWSPPQEALLSDPENPHFHYDLIGWIKAELIPAFYIPATDECAPVADVIALADRVGAIAAYSYLGDVGESVTGDKRAQKFEDDYLDALMDTVADLGFKAVAYMPTRNTPGAAGAPARADCAARVHAHLRRGHQPAAAEVRLRGDAAAAASASCARRRGR